MTGMSLEVYHDLCNKSLHKKLAHEWQFIIILLYSELKKGSFIAEHLVLFAAQYYPQFKWTAFDPNDLLSTVVIECALHDYRYLCVFEDVEESSSLTGSMFFGDIVTNFLIRCRGYSLISTSGQKIIVTSQSDCAKRFEKLLEKGFSLHRYSKLYLKKLPGDDHGFFARLPVLPTKEIYVDFEEVIEDGGKTYIIKPKK